MALGATRCWSHPCGLRELEEEGTKELDRARVSPCPYKGGDVMASTSIDVLLKVLICLSRRIHRLDQPVGLADGHDRVLCPVV